ncbi:uncharacterized protein THITE_2106159 [Thermothielavioides terrestris NRRL 8126]|uniref:Arca-like protein n=1 Tax=Thermothielavioides terrestris (strain ATCC 38088 / NRRL 8126) TaxID=578455 RepID=G2QW50_THETT|nr:uncharacterized protein THITE_2106159 [Thermothielavioides terrestris NRRL 8126]AEO62221.1 hypothetical protein THITE_2106159 [Thermothielavioides terrestris NRRL 8126]
MPPFQPASPPTRLRLMMISSVLDPPPPLGPPKWPLEDEDEACLFRHFVQKLAVWLDLCDPNHTFETVVPQRARDSPILLNAMFALSARHLSQTCNDDRKWHYHELAGRYNYACIKMINSLLGDARYQSSWTEHLFAAAIILQVMEEMNAALPVDTANQAADQGHLPGMYRFVETEFLEPGTLGAASFWVALRQEIYSAVTKRQPVRLNLDHPDLVDRSLEQTDEYTWANRAIVHCADVLNFCFNPERRPSLRRWEELFRWNQGWSERQPRSYREPLFRQHRDSAVFPEIWYHRSCQVIGVQHHLLAKLFLLDHRIRSGSPVTAGESDEVQEVIRKTVREICGIGYGNQWTPPGIFTACMAISAFGAYFRSVEDQDAMLAILEQTEKNHARPTEGVILDLLQIWGRHDLLVRRTRAAHWTQRCACSFRLTGEDGETSQEDKR